VRADGAKPQKPEIAIPLRAILITNTVVALFRGEKMYLGMDQKKHECKHCRSVVWNLEDRIDIEWWSDDDCGCERHNEENFDGD